MKTLSALFLATLFSSSAFALTCSGNNHEGGFLYLSVNANLDQSVLTVTPVTGQSADHNIPCAKVNDADYPMPVPGMKVLRKCANNDFNIYIVDFANYQMTMAMVERSDNDETPIGELECE